MEHDPSRPAVEPRSPLETAARLLNEGVMGFLAILALGLALAPVCFSVGPGTERVFQVADWAILAVFAAEYVVHLARAPDRKRYALSVWRLLDLVILVIPLVSLVPGVGEAARSSPALRLLRLFRAVLFGARAGGIVAREQIRRRAAAGLGPPQVTVVREGERLQPHAATWDEFLEWVSHPKGEWFHVSQVDESVVGLREGLVALIDLHMNVASFEMNKVMRLLAVISALGLIPAAVGGLLGMNLIDNPWPLTLPQVGFAVSMGMLLALYVFFVKGWVRQDFARRNRQVVGPFEPKRKEMGRCVGIGRWFCLKVPISPSPDISRSPFLETLACRPTIRSRTRMAASEVEGERREEGEGASLHVAQDADVVPAQLHAQGTPHPQARPDERPREEARETLVAERDGLRQHAPALDGQVLEPPDIPARDRGQAEREELRHNFEAEDAGRHPELQQRAPALEVERGFLPHETAEAVRHQAGLRRPGLDVARKDSREQVDVEERADRERHAEPSARGDAGVDLVERDGDGILPRRPRDFGYPKLPGERERRPQGRRFESQSGGRAPEREFPQRLLFLIFQNRREREGRTVSGPPRPPAALRVVGEHSRRGGDLERVRVAEVRRFARVVEVFDQPEMEIGPRLGLPLRRRLRRLRE